MRWRKPTAALALALALAGTVALAADEPLAKPKTDEDPILARAYEIRHRPVSDAAELIGPLLTPEGKLSFQPSFKTLMVEDRVSVLDKVGAVLRSFDLPPRNVEVTVTMFTGTNTKGEEAGQMITPTDVSDAVVDAMETLQKISIFTKYELLGSRSVRGTEGGRVTTALSDDYRVVFEIESVDDQAVRFKTFTVQKIIPLAGGGVRHEDLYTAAIVTKADRTQLIGAASGPDSKQALFISLQATPK